MKYSEKIISYNNDLLKLIGHIQFGIDDARTRLKQNKTGKLRELLTTSVKFSQEELDLQYRELLGKDLMEDMALLYSDLFGLYEILRFDLFKANGMPDNRKRSIYANPSHHYKLVRILPMKKIYNTIISDGWLTWNMMLLNILQGKTLGSLTTLVSSFLGNKSLNPKIEELFLNKHKLDK